MHSYALHDGSGVCVVGPFAPVLPIVPVPRGQFASRTISRDCTFVLLLMSTPLSEDNTSFPADLVVCQRSVGYCFRDVDFLTASLKHASGVAHRLASNERMEFLGDAILGFVVCEQLYQSYPDYLEGELTKIKSVVVSRDMCALVAERLGLQDYLLLGKGMAADPEIPRSVLAAALESLIAAIYLDGGIEAARKFILDNMNSEIEATAAGETRGNYKSQLQHFAQREHGVTPIYSLLDEKGPDHSKCFKVAAQVASEQFVPAWGRSKKESEQRAAHNAINQLAGKPIPYPSEDSAEQRAE